MDGGGGEDISLFSVFYSSQIMSASMKQKYWSLAQSPFTFGSRYKFILCCQQRDITWGAAGDSLAEVGLCPLDEAGSPSFWLSVVCSGLLQCGCPLWHCCGSEQGLFGISLRKRKNSSKIDLSEAYVRTAQREKAENTCCEI